MITLYVTPEEFDFISNQNEARYTFVGDPSRIMYYGVEIRTNPESYMLHQLVKLKGKLRTGTNVLSPETLARIDALITEAETKVKLAP